MALFRPTAVEHDRIVKNLERELAECRAVLADVNEERGLEPLWLVHVHEEGGDDGGPTVVVRAHDTDDLADGVKNYLEERYEDTGLGEEFSFRAALLVDEPRGVLRIDDVLRLSVEIFPGDRR